MAAVTSYANLTANLTPKGSYWSYSSGLTGPHGPLPQATSMVSVTLDGVPAANLPNACQAVANAGNMPATNRCLTSAHIRQFITYQPASRYWDFQGIETGLYILLAAALIAVTITIIRRRDA